MRLVNLAEYESRARDIAEDSTLDYYDGGSNDEITLRENVTAFRRITLYPRVFRGVGQRDTHTTILGLPASTPVMVAPVALIGMLHPEGEDPVNGNRDAPANVEVRCRAPDLSVICRVRPGGPHGHPHAA
jgi:isopentenyl diphosphate isomerase/L-lactate dehydrogenase-like FMN-dependent dehydrogenase